MSATRDVLAGLAFLSTTVSAAFWSRVAYLRLRAHGARVGRGLRVLGPIRLHCHRTAAIEIGDRCRIHSGFAGNPVGSSDCVAIWVGPGGRLRIGDGVGLSNVTIVCLRAVSIAEEALVGGGSRIYDTDFHSLDPEERFRPGNPGAHMAPVWVGRRAFVGGHSTILKGSTIGEGAVLGAGSVVRGHVPAYQVWMGNPARFARSLGVEAAAR